MFICIMKDWGGMVRDDLKLPDDGGDIPNLKEEVGGSNPSCEISSLLDGKLTRWSTASCALALACWPFVSQKKKEEIKIGEGHYYNMKTSSVLHTKITK